MSSLHASSVGSALAPFNAPARKRPRVLDRGLTAADEQHVIAAKADDSNGRDGRAWSGAGHRMLRKESEKTKHLQEVSAAGRVRRRAFIAADLGAPWRTPQMKMRDALAPRIPWASPLFLIRHTPRSAWRRLTYCP